MGKSIKSRLALYSLPQHTWQYLGNGCSSLCFLFFFFSPSPLSAFPICTLLPLLEGFSRECVRGGSPSGTIAGLNHHLFVHFLQAPSQAVLDTGHSARVRSPPSRQGHIQTTESRPAPHLLLRLISSGSEAPSESLSFLNRHLCSLKWLRIPKDYLKDRAVNRALRSHKDCYRGQLGERKS